MKRNLLVISLLISILFLGCKKHPNNNRSEADLAVITNPLSGTFQAASLEPFNLTVTITSTMPPSGVKIEVSARKDDGLGSAPFFSISNNSTNSANNFMITNTPVGVQCIVEIKVTSLTKSSNQWTGSYHYSRKS